MTQTRLSTFNDTLVAIDNWIESGDWAEAFSQFEAEFWELLPEMTNGLTFRQLTKNFSPLHKSTLHLIVLEAFIAADWEGVDSAYAAFLDETGADVDTEIDAYFRTLKGSLMRPYMITAVEPGASITLADMVFPDNLITVREHSASQSLRPRDYICARVVEPNGSLRLSGGIIPMSEENQKLVVEGIYNVQLELIKQGISSRTELGMEVLFEHVPDLAACLYALAFNDLPQLTNTGGDPISFVELRFKLRAPENQIASKLSASKDFFKGEDCWIFTDNKGARSMTVLGTLAIESNELVAETNSRRRAKDLDKRVSKLLGKLVGSAKISETTMEEALENFVPSKSRRDVDLSEEEQQIIREHLHDHYMNTLDEQIPFLGNGVPREMVKTKAGAQEVVKWLLLIESRTAENRQPPDLDFDFLWRELGIEHLRANA